MATSRNKSTTTYLCACRNSSSPMMSPSQSSSAFASSTSSATFTSRSCSSTASFLPRATSPTRVNMYNNIYRNSQSSPSMRLSIDRPTSPSRSLSMTSQRQTPPANPMTNQKRSCSCSPTTHPGSFRCAFHKALMRNSRVDNRSSSPQSASYHSSSRLNFRRSAMTNSIVRIKGVEGELVKRALSALIRPSSHHQRRRAAFEPRPSRLSVMSKAEDEEEESVN
ncbi:serine-rich protein-related [Euphorbia peplus]|nr:serine-rich protein-related [Euphorbia peplus]